MSLQSGGLCCNRIYRPRPSYWKRLKSPQLKPRTFQSFPVLWPWPVNSTTSNPNFERLLISRFTSLSILIFKTYSPITIAIYIFEFSNVCVVQIQGHYSHFKFKMNQIVTQIGSRNSESENFGFDSLTLQFVSQ